MPEPTNAGTGPRLFYLGSMVILLLNAVGVLLAQQSYGLATDEGWQAITRYSSRIAFLFFLLAFVARPLPDMLSRPWTQWLVRQRRYIGLAFALGFYLHLASVVAFHIRVDKVPGAVAFVGGGLAYLLLTCMVVTSTDQWQRRLGRNWRRLHRTGMYYLGVLFALAYVSKSLVQEAGGVAFLPFGLASLLPFLLRLLLWLRSRSRRGTARQAA